MKVLLPIHPPRDAFRGLLVTSWLFWGSLRRFQAHRGICKNAAPTLIDAFLDTHANKNIVSSSRPIEAQTGFFFCARAIKKMPYRGSSRLIEAQTGIFLDFVHSFFIPKCLFFLLKQGSFSDFFQKDFRLEFGNPMSQTTIPLVEHWFCYLVRPPKIQDVTSSPRNASLGVWGGPSFGYV